MRTTRFHIPLLSLAFAAVALAGCAGGGDATKAGGSGAPVTLRIGTDDAPDRPGAHQIKEFARQVRELSGGKLRIEPVWRAAGEGAADWDQQVARKVVSGELDLGMIPARAWDTEGVTSLRALHAPFLVTSDDLVAAIVEGELADEMLAGLESIGITGLALLPEGLRRLFAFGDPPASLGEFEGRMIRAPRSETTYALFEALGATADDLGGPGDRFNEAVRTGSVDMAESSFALASFLPAPATAVGNLVLFPKLNSLVVNSERLAGLSEKQRAILEEAATRTRTWAIGAMPTDAEAAERFCDGGAVVVASDSDLAELERAAAPVYAELEQDPQTKQFIDRIRALKSDVAATDAAVPATCGRAAGGGETAAGTGGATPVDGVYRTSFSLRDLKQSPLLDPGEINDGNWGEWTLTLDRGRVAYVQGNDVVTSSSSGTFTVDGDAIVLEFTQGSNAGETFAFRWTLDQGTLRFERDDSLGVGPTPFLVEPWQRSESTDSGIPDGVYRANVTEEDLVRAGMDRSEASEYQGLTEMTFKGGSLVVDNPAAPDDRYPPCYASYSSTGSTVDIDWERNCRGGMIATWSLTDGLLRFTGIRGKLPDETRIVRAVFGSKPFSKIG